MPDITRKSNDHDFVVQMAKLMKKARTMDDFEKRLELKIDVVFAMQIRGIAAATGEPLPQWVPEMDELVTKPEVQMVKCSGCPVEGPAADFKQFGNARLCGKCAP